MVWCRSKWFGVDRNIAVRTRVFRCRSGSSMMFRCRSGCGSLASVLCSNFSSGCCPVGRLPAAICGLQLCSPPTCSSAPIGFSVAFGPLRLSSMVLWDQWVSSWLLAVSPMASVQECECVCGQNDYIVRESLQVWLTTSFQETERRVARGEVCTRSNSRLAASTRAFPPYLQRLLTPSGLRR